MQNGKIIVGNLTMDKEDITLNTIQKFSEEISKAKTIVLAGVLGKYEDEGHSQGTKEIFSTIAASPAFKIVGGGDSLTAIEKYDLTEKFDWVSVGGGAMLEFLTKKTLPGIEAMIGKETNNRSSQIKEEVGIFLRDSMLQGKMSIDDIQKYAGMVDSFFSDDYTDDQLLENIKALDDNDPALTPIVMKLLGNWNNMQK
jgi:hypothetical protein